MTRFAAVFAVLVALCGAAILVSMTGEYRADRSAPPGLDETPALELPPIERLTLGNGLAVWLVEAHEVPLVQVNLVVRVGSGDDPVGQFGIASLTAAMLDEGAGGRTALEIADAIEFLGAALTTSSSFDASAVRLNVPSARLADALAVMADVAMRPTFPAAELERVRQERLTEMLQARADPSSVAPLAFARQVFGPSHRYGTAAGGTETTLKTFTVDDLRAFHASRYQPESATLVVSGDVTAEALLPQLERAFGNWRGAGLVKRASVLQAPQVDGVQITIVDMPGAEQSQVRIGSVGVPRSTPDYFTLQVLNTILGGSFTSRLNQNLREQHGYSYGAGSRFEMRLSAGAFFAGAGVQTDKTAESVREFFNELRSIGEPVPVAELSRAKSYVALSFPGEFETVQDLASQLEEMVVYDLPDSYYGEYVDKIQAVTGGAVQRAADTYVQTGRLAVVVVGDARVVEPGLRTLDLGPVRVMSVEEAIGP